MNRVWRRQLFWPAVLILVGAYFLLRNLGVIRDDVFWPLVLIAAGVWLIAARVGPAGSYAGVDSVEPREDLQQAKLDLAVGAGRVDVRSAPLDGQLYRAHLEHAGRSSEIRLDRPTGTVRVSQRFDWFAGPRRVQLDAQLTDAIPWQVSCSTGAIRGRFDLSSAQLSRFDCQTGASHIELFLGAPHGVVPIRIHGGALTVDVVRPAGAGVKVDASGGAVQLRGDGTRQDGVGSRSWASAASDAPDRYEMSVSGGAVTVNVSSR